MKRALLDTNVYIDWLNVGHHEPLVLGPGLVRHMSTVVLMELEAGATTLAARRAIGQLSLAFERTGRLVAPSPAAWKRAGSVLRGLRAPMSPKAAEVVEQARKLSEEERRELAMELLDSAITPEIQAAWIDEARQRVAEVDSGQVATLSNEEALRLVATDD